MPSTRCYRGVVGYPVGADAPRPGAIYDVAFKGKPFEFERPFGSYVMENVLFKISFPAEFHAQTAVECAMQLHAQVAGRLEQIEKIVIETQEAGCRIIDKTGPLANYADRDHCIQYMVAVPLIFGRLTADDYNDEVAADPRIDALRDKMVVSREPAVHQGLLRSGQALHRQFGAGVLQGRQPAPEKVSIDYPDRPPQAPRRGHSRCCCKKFEAAMRGASARPIGSRQFSRPTADPAALDSMPVQQFLELFTL